MSIYKFPETFIWGAATAALQIEGSPNADGAGKTTWQTLCARPGAIANDDNVDIACDHFNRYKEDVQLLKEIGVKNYRFSINWARIFPEGTGKVNQKGVDFYSRLIDELLANNITPYATMFHWETPQALEDRFGGWRSKETCKAFAEYAGFMAGKIGDRVKNFFTVNEVICFSLIGHGAGSVFAPRVACSYKEKLQTAHNGCLAHGMAVQSMRANLPSDVKIGLAQNPVSYVPLYETAENIDAARSFFREKNASMTTLIMEGKYRDSFIEEVGKDMPDYTSEELAIINTPIDFLALNLYTAQNVAVVNGTPMEVPLQNGHPRMNTEWLNFLPETIYWTVRFCQELWNPKEMFISENGCATDDKIDYETGEIFDTARVMYLRQNLMSLHRAVSENIRVNGYFQWSLMDNFEWTGGYIKRFGMCYVDFNTQKRTLKSSAKFYRETMKNNSIQ